MPDSLYPTETAGGAYAQASNLDALMIEVSVTAGRGMIAVCCEDEGEPELVAVRPLAARAVAGRSQDDWQEQADAVIFGWLVSP
jgi:hypothetical protein